MNIRDAARILRKQITPAERRMWNALRNRSCGGYKFRRQYPIGKSFIADFYCAKAKLVIELDGSVHDLPEVQVYDTLRQDVIEDLGYHVLRFSNEDVFSN